MTNVQQWPLNDQRLAESVFLGNQNNNHALVNEDVSL